MAHDLANPAVLLPFTIHNVDRICARDLSFRNFEGEFPLRQRGFRIGEPPPLQLFISTKQTYKILEVLKRCHMIDFVAALGKMTVIPTFRTEPRSLNGTQLIDSVAPFEPERFLAYNTVSHFCTGIPSETRQPQLF